MMRNVEFENFEGEISLKFGSSKIEKKAEWQKLSHDGV